MTGISESVLLLNCSINSMGNLDVVIPPDIISDEETTDGGVAPENGSVRLRCKATGVPEPMVLWRREDSKTIVLRHDGGREKQGWGFMRPPNYCTSPTGRGFMRPPNYCTSTMGRGFVGPPNDCLSNGTGFRGTTQRLSLSNGTEIRGTTQLLSLSNGTGFRGTTQRLYPSNGTGFRGTTQLLYLHNGTGLCGTTQRFSLSNGEERIVAEHSLSSECHLRYLEYRSCP
uniref:Ig-like domain-containing protein n=1 Tax=Timema bartmani TaxID=61472 RepID=A0A7R9ER28_9NEOP|nr:unnamed protein product [Timema bartmani]